MARDFGIYPDGIIPKLWWGCRAIATDRKHGLDIPMDRQNFDGDKDSPDKNDFFDWLNHVAIPELDRRFKNYENVNIEFDSKDGRFHCAADEYSSGGYLYIGAWRKHKWKCKFCGCIIFNDDFDDFDEENLWGHIQMDHEDIFDDVRDLETPFMLEECYDEV